VTAGRDFASVHPVSALKRKGLDTWSRACWRWCPSSRAAVCRGRDHRQAAQRFLAGELVREQLMRQLGDELPYAATVEIENFDEDGELLRIGAVIWVEREGQKPIVIGKGGERMKRDRPQARIQGWSAVRPQGVPGNLWCKVREGWSDDEAALRRFGYGD
jgi:GTPase